MAPRKPTDAPANDDERTSEEIEFLKIMNALPQDDQNAMIRLAQFLAETEHEKIRSTDDMEVLFEQFKRRH